jgi:hypothetical protein
MKRELSNDPGSAEMNEKARSRVRLWTWIALLSLPVALLVVWWGAHVSLRGDYLSSPRMDWGRVVRLTASPIPKHEGLGMIGVRAPFVVGLDREFYAFGAGFSGETRVFRFDSLPGEPKHELLLLAPRDGDGRAVERYPVGALADVMAGWESGRLALFIAEAEKLEARFPERLTPKYWIVAGLFADGRRDQALSKLAAWRSDFEKAETWRGEWYLALLENDVLASTPDQVAIRDELRDRFDLPATGRRPRIHDLADTLAWFESQRGRPPARFLSLSAMTPNFLEYQVGTKVARVEAIFAMARGERERAANLAFGAAVVGLDLQEGESATDIRALVAIAIVAISNSGIADLFAHGNASAQEIEAIWPDLAKLARTMAALDEKRLQVIFFPWAIRHRSHPSAANPNFPEAVARAHVARAQVDLLREALRARHHQRRFAAWPAISANESLEGDLLAADPPIVDPFEPTRPPRAELRRDTLRLWSIGPDKKNDAGAFSYDPTTGRSARAT